MVMFVYDLKPIISLLLIIDRRLIETLRSDTWKIYANKVLNMGSVYSLQLLEAAEQRREAGQAAIYSDVLQSPVQEFDRV